MQRSPHTAQSVWTRLQRWPDSLLFGPESEQHTTGGGLRRAARYPYALLRDLLTGGLTLHAMGLVYTSLLAIVPLLAFSFGILKAFHAQGVLEPLVHEFFRPMGSAADDLTARVMDFANTVRGLIGLPYGGKTFHSVLIPLIIPQPFEPNVPLRLFEFIHHPLRPPNLVPYQNPPFPSCHGIARTASCIPPRRTI